MTTTNTLGTKNLTFSVGIPNVIMQVLDGQVIKRMLTLEAFDDYSLLDKGSQKNVICKVAKVALATLFVSLTVAFITVEVVWMLPLCLLVTMGLSFGFLTSNEYASTHYGKVADQAKKSVQKEVCDKAVGEDIPMQKQTCDQAAGADEIFPRRVTRSQAAKNKSCV